MDDILQYTRGFLDLGASNQSKISYMRVPNCKVCGRPAWLSLKGKYSLFCCVECSQNYSNGVDFLDPEIPEDLPRKSKKYQWTCEGGRQIAKKPFVSAFLAKKIARELKRKSEEPKDLKFLEIISENNAKLNKQDIDTCRYLAGKQENQAIVNLFGEKQETLTRESQYDIASPNFNSVTHGQGSHKDFDENIQTKLGNDFKDSSKIEKEKTYLKANDGAVVTQNLLKSPQMKHSEQKRNVADKNDIIDNNEFQNLNKHHTNFENAQEIYHYQAPGNKLSNIEEKSPNYNTEEFEKVCKLKRELIINLEYQKQKVKLLESIRKHEITQFLKEIQSSGKFHGQVNVSIVDAAIVHHLHPSDSDTYYRCQIRCPLNYKEEYTWFTNWKKNGVWNESTTINMEWDTYPFDKSLVFELYMKLKKDKNKVLLASSHVPIPITCNNWDYELGLFSLKEDNNKYVGLLKISIVYFNNQDNSKSLFIKTPSTKLSDNLMQDQREVSKLGKLNNESKPLHGLLRKVIGNENGHNSSKSLKIDQTLMIEGNQQRRKTLFDIRENNFSKTKHENNFLLTAYRSLGSL